MISSTDFIAKVREIAQDNPMMSYNTVVGMSCDYEPDAQNPLGCIMGAALTALNVDLPKSTMIISIVKSIDWKNTAHRIWATEVQGYQDNGNVWPECVIRGDTKVAEQYGPEYIP